MNNRNRQKGAVIVTTALFMLFLLGMMAFATDFGHLFVVKGELQTATDSCALAAVQELDGAADALDRATRVGRTTGNFNKVNFQEAEAGFVDTDITFSATLNGVYSRVEPAATAKYVKCAHQKAGMAPWLFQAMSAFTGDDAFKANQSVSALGVATRAPAQTNCALPIGICKKPAPGYAIGEWLSGAVNSAEAVTGQFRWLDFTGNGGGAKELKDVLRGEGQCNLPGKDTVVGAPGNKGSAADAYNTRFGIYQGAKKPPGDGIPDLTGYAWYKNGPIVQPPYPNKYPAFVAKRLLNAPYQGDNKAPDTTGLNTVGKTYTGSLATVGANRRVVTVPVVNCAAFDGLGGGGTIKVESLACVLLLHPIKKGAGPNSEKMWLEYLGAADSLSSPCSTIGLAGGDGGPLVPTLVQ